MNEKAGVICRLIPTAMLTTPLFTEKLPKAETLMPKAPKVPLRLPEKPLLLKVTLTLPAKPKMSTLPMLTANEAVKLKLPLVLSEPLTLRLKNPKKSRVSGLPAGMVILKPAEEILIKILPLRVKPNRLTLTLPPAVTDWAAMPPRAMAVVLILSNIEPSMVKPVTGTITRVLLAPSLSCRSSTKPGLASV